MIDHDPVFAEPWQARAFAMVVKLHEAGLFTWPEWAAALSAQIATGGDDYYRHWLAALEKVLEAKQVASFAEQRRYRDAWDHAADRTPHGQPIALLSSDFEDNPRPSV